MTTRPGKTIADIVPPRPIPGMEKALPDYSARLARRTYVSEDVVAAKYDNHVQREDA